MKNELKATTFKPNRKRNVSVAKRLGNAVSFRVSAEGLVAGVSTKNLQEPKVCPIDGWHKILYNIAH